MTILKNILTGRSTAIKCQRYLDNGLFLNWSTAGIKFTNSYGCRSLILIAQFIKRIRNDSA